MNFYFSGVRCADDLRMLEEAGAERIMVDPDHLCLISAFGGNNTWQGRSALDSGSYARFVAKKPVGDDYVTSYQGDVALIRGMVDFYVSPDEIGNPERTLRNYNMMRLDGFGDAMPVWGWQSTNLERLRFYLDCSPVVGIGGLVPFLRDRLDDKLTKPERDAWNKERRKTLDLLVDLCARWSGRFHLFGLNWLVAIKECKPYAKSADSAKWIRAAGRHGYVVFLHRKTGALSQAPARMIKEFAELNRRGRCIQSAIAISEYCNILT